MPAGDGGGCLSSAFPPHLAEAAGGSRVEEGLGVFFVLLKVVCMLSAGEVKSLKGDGMGS